LVSIDGQLVEERYFQGARPSDWANLKSASKSVLSTLVGIALDQGHLKSVRDPLGMLKIGDLYLNRGRVGDKQVVSEAWIQQSLEARTQSRWSGREYGYGW
jgi:CubicO group peptidase (beta-lactamase class C family)